MISESNHDKSGRLVLARVWKFEPQNSACANRTIGKLAAGGDRLVNLLPAFDEATPCAVGRKRSIHGSRGRRLSRQSSDDHLNDVVISRAPGRKAHWVRKTFLLLLCCSHRDSTDGL
jgi:hypothetical protein